MKITDKQLIERIMDLDRSLKVSAQLAHPDYAVVGSFYTELAADRIVELLRERTVYQGRIQNLRKELEFIQKHHESPPGTASQAQYALDNDDQFANGIAEHVAENICTRYEARLDNLRTAMLRTIQYNVSDTTKLLVRAMKEDDLLEWEKWEKESM